MTIPNKIEAIIMDIFGYKCIHTFDAYPNIERTYSKVHIDYVINIHVITHTDGESDLAIFKAPIVDGKYDWNSSNDTHVYDLNVDDVEEFMTVMNRESVIDNILSDE